MDEYKSINKYLQKSKKKESSSASLELGKFLKTFTSKILICLIIFLLFIIGNKMSDKFKERVYDKVYNNTFSFAMLNNWYENNFGSLFPINSLINKEVPVFSEKLVYKSANIYKDGVALKVSSNYLVPVIGNGIVIFVGDKEEYGSTVIVQQENGLDVWYCNINKGSIEMYDYISEGSFIGEAKGEEIYMLFQKDGKFLDYKDYI